MRITVKVRTLSTQIVEPRRHRRPGRLTHMQPTTQQRAPRHVHTEASLEASFRYNVRRAGGALFKLAPTTKGIPDRLVVFPPGRIYLVELKTEHGVLSDAQVEQHHRLRELGVPVHVLYGYDRVSRWPWERMTDYDSGIPDTDQATLVSGLRPWTDRELGAICSTQRPTDSTLSIELDRTVTEIRAKRRELKAAAASSPEY